MPDIKRIILPAIILSLIFISGCVNQVNHHNLNFKDVASNDNRKATIHYDKLRKI